MHVAGPKNDVFEPINVIPFNLTRHHVKVNTDGYVGLGHSHASQRLFEVLQRR